MFSSLGSDALQAAEELEPLRLPVTPRGVRTELQIESDPLMQRQIDVSARLMERDGDSTLCRLKGSLALRRSVRCVTARRIRG